MYLWPDTAGQAGGKPTYASMKAEDICLYPLPAEAYGIQSGHSSTATVHKSGQCCPGESRAVQKTSAAQPWSQNHLTLKKAIQPFKR